jgi:hypothetical protein
MDRRWKRKKKSLRRIVGVENRYESEKIGKNTGSVSIASPSLEA